MIVAISLQRKGQATDIIDIKPGLNQPIDVIIIGKGLFFTVTGLEIIGILARHTDKNVGIVGRATIRHAVPCHPVIHRGITSFDARTDILPRLKHVIGIDCC